MQDIYTATIGADHPSLPGHFPGRPVIPGVVLLTELQVALSAHLGWPCHITGIGAVKFTRPLLPGQAFTIRLETEDHKARFTVVQKEQTIAGGNISFSPPGEQA